MSRRLNLELAVEEVVESISPTLQGAQPELAIAFVSSAHRGQYGDLVHLLRGAFPKLKTIVGCSAFGVLGMAADGPQEVEHAPAFSLAVACLPKTRTSATYLTAQDLPDGDSPPDAWARCLGLEPAGPDRPPLSFIVLADPAFEDTEALLAGLDYAFPEANKAGGLCSSGAMSSARALFSWDAVRDGEAQAVPTTVGAGSSGGGGAVESSSSAAGLSSEGVELEGGAATSSSTISTSSTSSSARSGGGEGEGEGGEPSVEESIFGEAAGEEPRESSMEAAAGGEGVGVRGQGAVVLCLEGGVEMESLIAQGCRPISSRTWSITQLGRDQAGRPVIVEVAPERGIKAGCSPMEALQRDLSELELAEEQLVDLLQNLTLGLAPPGQEGGELEAHQYLIRGMMPLGRKYMMVGDTVRLGQSLRFMVRDKQGAEDDMQSHGVTYKRRQLQEMMEGCSRPPPFGVLAFTCSGRGLELFGRPHHDASTLQQFIPAPLAGFMCNGEIARVGGTTRLHGFTCSTAVLRELNTRA